MLKSKDTYISFQFLLIKIIYKKKITLFYPLLLSLITITSLFIPYFYYYFEIRASLISFILQNFTLF